MPPGTDAQAEFDQGVALLGQGRYDAAKETLRAAAEHGHVAAAAALGRLLCLDAHAWLPTDTPGEDYVSAAEPWLRRALHLDPTTVRRRCSWHPSWTGSSPSTTATATTRTTDRPQLVGGDRVPPDGGL